MVVCGVWGAAPMVRFGGASKRRVAKIRTVSLGALVAIALQGSACSDDAVHLSRSSSDDIARLLGRNLDDQIELSDDVTRVLRDRLQLSQGELANVAQDVSTTSFVDRVLASLRTANESTDGPARDYLVNVACAWYDDRDVSEQDLANAGAALFQPPGPALQQAATELSGDLEQADSNGDAGILIGVAVACYVAG